MLPVRTLDKLTHWSELKSKIADNPKESFFFVASFSFFFIASLFFSGYSIYVENQPLQIPIINLNHNPSLYPNDPFAETLKYYTTLVWLVVSYLTKFAALDKVLFVGFLLERLMLLVGAGTAGYALFPKIKWAPLVAIAAFALCPQPFLGSGTLVNYYFEQTGCVIACLLFALAFFVKRDRYLWAIFSAIAFNINVMYCAYAMTYFLCAFLFISDYRLNWRKWILPGTLFFLLSLPMYLWARTALSFTEVNVDLWVQVSRIRLHHHLFPLTFELDRYIKHIVLSVWILCMAWRHRRNSNTNLLSSLTYAFFLVGMLWLGFAFFAAYIKPDPRLLVWHPARALDIWYLYLGVALPCFLFTELADKNVRNPIFLILCVLTFMVFWAPDDALLDPAIISAALYLIIYCVKRSNFQPLPIKHLAQLSTLTLIMASGYITLSRYEDEGVFFYQSPSKNRMEMYSWIQENTTEESSFMVPVTDFENFRSIAMRSNYCDFKDCSAILWHFPYVEVWNERMSDIGFSSTNKLTKKEARKLLDNLYLRLSDEDIIRLKEKYKLDYWIINVDHATNFPVVYQNDEIKIVSLKSEE